MIPFAKLVEIVPEFSDQAIILVDVEPKMPCNQCHENVEALVKEHGGHRATGYTFVSVPDENVLHVTWHSIWQKPDGSLLDVTAGVPHSPNTLLGVDGKRYYLPCGINTSVRPDKAIALIKAKKDVVRKINREY